jgi:hypothetical protein
MQRKCTPSSLEEPSEPFQGCTCLVLERDHPSAHEFIAQFDELAALVPRLFAVALIVIIIRTPDGALNSISATNRVRIVRALNFACQWYPHSRWGVLCTPPVALVAMAELRCDAYSFVA